MAPNISARSVVCGEGTFAGEDFVEDDTESEDIGFGTGAVGERPSACSGAM